MPELPYIPRYAPDRLRGLTLTSLTAIVLFARLDETSPTLRYDGMSRADTVATAVQSRRDAMDEIHARALAERNA